MKGREMKSPARKPPAGSAGSCRPARRPQPPGPRARMLSFQKLFSAPAACPHLPVRAPQGLSPPCT